MLRSSLILKVKSTWGKHIFMGIWGIGALGMGCTLVINVIISGFRHWGLIFLGMLLAGVGVLALNHFIWNLFGYTRIDFNSRRIVIQDVRNLFKHKEVINLEDWMEAKYDKEKLGIAFRFWEFNFGDILILHKKGERRIGKGLKKRECEAFANKLNKKVKSQPRL